MTSDGPAGAAVSPEAAFALLGNETRMAILRELSRTDEPLSFSDLRERVAVGDSGQFNYHLDKLVGRFVRHVDDGYTLRRAGERVIEAVLSGAVTDAPVLEPAEIDQVCPYCGAPLEVSFAEERVEFYCTSCAGVFGSSAAQASFEIEDHGYLGRLSLPPAGLLHRSPAEIARAAWIWSELEFMAMSMGLCPRCAADVEHSLTVCPSHDATGGRCDTCGRRYAANVRVVCSNCILDVNGLVTVLLAANTEFLAFLTGHGINPLIQGWDTAIYDEEIHSTDPFEGRFTYTVGDDQFSLTLDDDLNVVDATTS